MMKCQETKKTRSLEKGSGRVVTKYVWICGLAAAEGSEFCPRHGFLRQLKECEAQDKDVAAHIEHRVRQSGNPRTRRELIERGYQYTGNRECRECHKPIEWWRKPNSHQAPYDPMADADSPSVSHFATCTCAASFRRAS